ncbi:MAG TPA: DMT family transporter [Bryobacteraceae bacterium]|nr:DMT family transporter [Bryobacteraceae bacterium]
MPSDALKSRAYLLLAALLFSTGGAVIKGSSFAAWEIAGARSLIAAVVLVALVPEARRRVNWRHLLVGLSYALTLVSFVAANKLTTSANAIFLQSTGPIYLLLAAPLLLKESVTRADALAMALMAAGMSLFFVDAETATTIATDPARGNILAAFSGAAWAGVVAGLRWLERDTPGSGPSTVAAGNAIAFLISLPFLSGIPKGTAIDWLGVAYLGCFQLAVAYVLLSRGLRRVPALEASLLLLLEPALNPFWTWLVLRERPSAWAIAGGALILSATIARLRR